MLVKLHNLYICLRFVLVMVAGIRVDYASGYRGPYLNQKRLREILYPLIVKEGKEHKTPPKRRLEVGLKLKKPLTELTKKETKGRGRAAKKIKEILDDSFPQ